MASNNTKKTTVRWNYSEKVFSQMAKLDLAAAQRKKSKDASAAAADTSAYTSAAWRIANGPTLELEENEVGEQPAAAADDLTDR